MKISVKLGLETLSRYFLGLVMIFYGLLKIFQLQFVLPAPVFESSLKELDGVTLTWAFLGHSSWFSILLGIFEFLPGLLLLFRKTSFLGSILIFPLVLSVFLININYGFLPFMQLFTGILLLIDLGLLLIKKDLLKKIMLEIIQQEPTKRSAIEFIFNTFIIGSILLIIIFSFA
jgi:hypothetical protein